MPKIMLVSDHYARVVLAEISPMNPRYHPNESPKLKMQQFNSVVLLLKATNNNAENVKCVKHVSIVCQQFGICLSLAVLEANSIFFLTFSLKIGKILAF